MKRIINVSLIIYAVIFICHNFAKQKNISFSIGNTIKGDYIYSYNDMRITDIINDINNNKKISNRSIQNILVKAKTIYIDLNDLIKCDNYNCSYTNISDLDRLLILIKKYCKEKIIIKLLTEDNEINNYTNEKVMISARNYDIITMR